MDPQSSIPLLRTASPEESKGPSQAHTTRPKIPNHTPSYMQTSWPEPSCSCHVLNNNRRNLVICIDGTSNQFGPKNSSVIEFYHLLIKDENQLTYYDSGIGTYAKPSWKSPSFWLHVAESKLDLAFAFNFEKIMLEAYSWLSRTYRAGDVVLLFGFSRGAYQVRALSAMIEKVGLIHKGNEAQIPFAFELYAKSDNDFRAARFKETFSREIKVHFVGAWDTVSSVGIVRGKTLPMTTEGMTHVCHFRHALALDERRVKFLPEYAYGGVSLEPKKVTISSRKRSLNVQSSQGLKEPARQILGDHNQPTSEEPKNIKKVRKEVWFAGTHSDIGGGNTENDNLDRSGPPLMWMLSEAISCGLLVSQKANTSKRWEWRSQDGPHESLSGIWRWFEYLPIKRFTYREQDLTTRRLHRGRGRKVLHGQHIHGSLILDEESEYRPRASAPGGQAWDSLLKDPGNWLEKDLLGTAKILFNIIQDRVKHGNGDLSVVEPDLKKLLETINSVEGQWTLLKIRGVEKFIGQLIELTSEEERFRELRDRLVEVFLGSVTRIITSRDLRALLPTALDIQSNQHSQVRAAFDEYMKEANLTWKGVEEYTGDRKLNATEIGEYLCDIGKLARAETTGEVMSVTLLSGGERIITGSFGGAVEIWDTTSGRRILDLDGHLGDIHHVALSPDGTLIASCSADNTIRIWEAQTGTYMGRFSGHKSSVTFVTFTLDGKNIISSSADKSVRIWNIKSRRNTRQLTGHTDCVWCVAISPDQKLIASGSDDKTIRIWDLQKAKNTAEPLTGHVKGVNSVTFSPDGQQLVSGSDDYTIRVWSATTGQSTMCLKGHSESVWCVAVSPDGRFIASCSADETIRLWELQTGKSLSEPLKGHTDEVNSVTFSQDGKYIVSGSDDRTVRRWRLSAFGIIDPTPDAQE